MLVSEILFLLAIKTSSLREETGETPISKGLP